MSNTTKPMSKDQAASWSKNYKRRNLGKTTSFLVKKEVIELLLKQNPEGIRIYLGAADDHEIKLMLAAQLDGKVNTQELYGGDETLEPCPPVCGWPPSID